MNENPESQEPVSYAYQGDIEILNATWSLDEGRMVEFRLCGDAYGKVHPFKKYQQRRNGRVGMRFAAAFAAEGEPVRYQGEVMLASWKDSSTAGQSVRLWLDNEHTEHPFAGCQRRKNGTPGSILFLVLVELDDDQSSVNQEQRDRVAGGGSTAPDAAGVHDQRTAGGASAGTAAPGPGGPGTRPGGAGPAAGRGAGGARPARKLSSSAHLLVSGPLFLRYLRETKANLVKDWTSDKARVYAKSLIKVESLSALDRDPEAVKRFHELIRKPYDRWYRQEP